MVCPCRLKVASLVFVATAAVLTGRRLDRADAEMPTVVASSPSAPVPVDADHAAKMREGLELFKNQVRPLLVKSCVRCHGGKETESEFDLTTRESLLKGGAEGKSKTVIPGDATHSRLYKLISHQQEPKMPEEGSKLSADQIANLARWIDLGAPYDRPLLDKAAAGQSWTETVVPAKAREFWAFQPLHRVAPPQVAHADWVRTDIDRFVMARLESKGLTPNAPAERRVLIRRACFDLTGLPPTPAEIDAFVQDNSPDAYEKLLDRLLASPGYGERWARHWLDVARFAESFGFEHDYDRKYAFHYRDFVIRALNEDMPYDQFVRWQLAGDELKPDDPMAMMATGFLGAGVFPTQITANEVERTRYDALDDMTTTTGVAMLGLSVGCARCHDHKFDPIPQADYYRFLSTFTTAVRSEVDLPLEEPSMIPALKRFDEEHLALTSALQLYDKDSLPQRFDAWIKKNSMAKDPAPAPGKKPDAAAGAATAILKDVAAAGGPGKLTADARAKLLVSFRTLDPEWQRLNDVVARHEKLRPKAKLTKVMIVSEGVKPMRLHTQGADFFDKTYYLNRGDANQKVGEATQDFLQVLDNAPEGAQHWQVKPASGAKTSMRRTALARWVTDTEYGAGQLAARVIVNRLWQHHFGQGIVATPNDFGKQGQPPSNPELLDYLAGRLIDGGWRLKPLHKQIMLSAVYMQNSLSDEQRTKVDPQNELLWRHIPSRLDAEVIRDSLLSVSGLLDRKMFGPGTLDPQSTRRSVYFTVKRSELVPMMQLFDAPEALVSQGARPTTTIAPQALLLMNSSQVRRCAQRFAETLKPAADKSLDAAMRQGFLTAVGREPTAAELSDCGAFITQQSKSYEAAGNANARQQALTDFCQAVLALNEFVYVD